MAKEPVPGRVKTRLCPPCNASQAAELAAAALVDTLDAVARCGADRRLLALDGRPGPWLPEGFEVFPQQGIHFDRRLAAAWDRAGGPGVQIGMDTPQVTAELLDHCLQQVVTPPCTAALGLTDDGGWWALALQRPDPAVFLGVPMSTPRTGWLQERRLRDLGHDPVRLPPLRDVDFMVDAVAVANEAPGTRFAEACRRVVAVV
jgi:glycosyltransferase A (GT-A) superfamily protein (DUF2064 family)